ncbi:hypothetical protein pEaSNUABM52_00075 [Erwinia phage pEp_SNUABM_52]|nr:hypothetical protein pEaSNUABM52_00075 [Erwinia phage pEp_SNUABM_52]
MQHNLLLPQWKTEVLSLIVEDGRAVGVVRSSLVRKSKTIMTWTKSYLCMDITRREFFWSDVTNLKDLRQSNNAAKALSKRLRTELAYLIAEGKLDGSVIRSLEHRKPVTEQL